MHRWYRPGIWLFLSLVFPGCTLAGATRSATTDLCPIDPGLNSLIQECQDGGGSMVCHYVANLKALARGDVAASETNISRALAGLGQDAVTALIPRLQVLTLAMLEPKQEAPCLEKLAPLLMKFLASSLQQDRDPPAAMFFLGKLLYPLSDKQLKILEEKTPPELRPRVVEARKAFESMLERTATGKRILKGEGLAAALSLLGRLSQSPPPTGLIPPGLQIPEEMRQFLPSGGLSEVSELLQNGVEAQRGGRFKVPADLSEVSELFRRGVEAQQGGRLQEALEAYHWGMRGLDSLQPNSFKGRALRLVGSRLLAELSDELKQSGAAAIQATLGETLDAGELDLAEEFLRRSFGDVLLNVDEKSAFIKAIEEVGKVISVPGAAKDPKLLQYWEISSILLGDRLPETGFTDAQIAAAKGVFQAGLEAAVQLGKQNLGDAADEVETLAAHSGPGEKQLLEMNAHWLRWKGGKRTPAVLDGVEATLRSFENHVESSYSIDSAMEGFLDEDAREIFDRAVGLLAEGGRQHAAFVAAEKGRSFTLRRVLAADRAAGLADNTRYAQAVRLTTLELAELRREVAESTGAARARAQERLTTQIARLEYLAFEHHLEAEKRRLGNAVAADIKAVQATLAPDQTLLAFYFVNDEELLLWRIDSGSDELLRLEIPRETWSKARCFAASAARLPRGADLLCVADWNGWRELHQALLGQIASRLRREIIVVPHGVLHGFAFAALEDGTRGRRLIEDHTVSFAPSATIWKRLASRPAAPSAGVLVLGDPAVPELARLAGARQEAEGVARLFGSAVFLGGEATESHLRAGLRARPSLIHLAAHGIRDFEHPRQSYVALTADRDATVMPAGAPEDGRLTAFEVEELLDLQDTELVTLSACETALGDLNQGDEVVGLTRSFLVAGSRAVLSTLWKVDDKASSELMQKFYQHWQAGAPAAMALRQAQNEIRLETKTAAPYYWAGYILTGDPQARHRPRVL